MRRHLVIFLRVPTLGHGKTRLAAGIGPIGALHFQRHSANQLIRCLSRDPRWTMWLAVTPDLAVKGRRPWPGGGKIMPQGTGDLGPRMARFFHHLTGPVVIIGSDLPDISRPDIWSAFRALTRKDLVLGPAEDGGYWLIGARHRLRADRLFRGVRWSSAHTLSDTVRNLPCKADLALLQVRFDIDTAADWARWRARREGSRRRPRSVCAESPQGD